eukprot:gb/GEZN01001781.1/.p1 GENE.gb/GEZN01001781.1/~~gb/GEZN01001781.1/.p1  ORF type:complete len:747 (+),score=118.53 gb/GEZN01001781.1/:81-2321(+)
MQFQEFEQRDGVRFSWNVFPTTRLEATRMAVPIGCMYTPLKPVQDLYRVPVQPLLCKSCKAVLNPYCKVDFMNKIWHCPFCLTRNHFPHSYSQISDKNLPPELMPRFTTLEYAVQTPDVPQPPTFLFVVDTCMIEEELKCLREAIQQSLMLMPESAKVGLITFGRHVQIHELGFEFCPKAYVIQAKDYKPQDMANLLGLSHKISDKGESKNVDRFLLPVADCDTQLNTVLDELSRDSWPHKGNQRPSRCTGSALNTAIGLLEATSKGTTARIMLFVGGPCTIGPGMVVSTDRSETLRSHMDLQKGNVPHYKKAVEYYTRLAKQCAKNGHVTDIFACALDQVGLAEMKVCVEETGGLLVLDDSFSRGVFRGSLKQVFGTDEQEGHLTMCFKAELQVLTSRELHVTGAVGCLTGLDRKHQCVSSTQVGHGGTIAWNIGGLDPLTTAAVFFEVVNEAASEAPQAYMQFVATYTDSGGTLVQRVTTVAKTFADASTEQGRTWLKAGFDQEAAAVLMARRAVWKTRTEYTFDILRWLDSHLIRLVSKFATYQKDDPSSLRLSQEFSYYPQFMFHLRRSQFLQVFNSSPDEVAFFRVILLREDTTNSLVMIQPSLVAYSLEGPAQPVQLDMTSRGPQKILLLDTFFHIVIWYGETINQWQLKKVHEDPAYDYFKQLLLAPEEQAQTLVSSRFPTPRFIKAIQGASQERFLLAKLNPSITPSAGAGAENMVFSEDVSLSVFMQHLRRLAVQPT